MLLNASNLKKSFSERVLFDNVSFNIDAGDRIGFIGANGAGKSTLFKIITGEYDYDYGEIFKGKNLKIGYLDQYSCADSEKSIIDEILSVFEHVIEIENELEDIRLKIEMNGADDALIARQTELNERFAGLDGFYYRSKAKSMLIGLGFDESDFDMPVSKLSGGQKTRIELGKILLSDSNLLLLDEPTNHLDITSVEWLEEFLTGYRGAFIVISHDRYFLDRVTNKTFELDNGHLGIYTGSYSSYTAQKELERKTQQRQYDNTMREIKRLEGVVEQQRRWNREKNIKTAESKLKVIERLEETLAEPNKARENMFYGFTAAEGGGNDVLIADRLGMRFGEGAPLFSGADLHIVKGEKVFLLGPNGCGKTTLLKIILGIYRQTEGEFKIGSNIKIGYYDQIQENLSQDKNIFDEIHDEYPNMTETEIRNALALFLFRGDDVFKEIRMLSGGERARVELVKLILKKVNFLIMDEPTNHLDIEAREALENALDGYGGTMLIVSHDRYFINKLANRILYLDKNGITSYIGGYDDFYEKHHEAAEPKKKNSTPQKGLDYKERKAYESEKRKTLNRFSKTEEEITCTEEEINNLNTELMKPEIATDYVKAAELSEKVSELTDKLDALYAQWEELQRTIEERGY